MKYGERKKITAIYVRVSTKQQSTDSQMADLKAWAANKAAKHIRWYEDKWTGKTLDRPAWNEVYELIKQNKVASLVVWRLDRLGRTASGLTALFEKLSEYKVNFVSVKDGIDLKTAAGRLIANVMASVAAYETEIRGERVQAGMAVAKANGVVIGGRKPGILNYNTQAKVADVIEMFRNGVPKVRIAKLTGLSRPTVIRMLRNVDSPQD